MKDIILIRDRYVLSISPRHPGGVDDEGRHEHVLPDGRIRFRGLLADLSGASGGRVRQRWHEASAGLELGPHSERPQVGEAMGPQPDSGAEPSTQSREVNETILHHRLASMYAVLAAPRDQQGNTLPEGHG